MMMGWTRQVSRSKKVKFSMARPAVRHSSSLAEILRRVQEGSLDIDKASKAISATSSSIETQEETLTSFANLDHGRSLRTGFPEAVFAEGKTPQQVASILDDMARSINESAQTPANPNDAVHTAILATR
jgi:NCAIR mutase (PurE)-related protein